MTATFQISTSAAPKTLDALTIASIRKDPPTVLALPAIPWPAVTRRAPTWTNVPTKHCPISVVRIIVRTWPAAPSASVRPVTNSATTRKHAKVNYPFRGNFFAIFKMIFTLWATRRYRRVRQGKWRLFARMHQSQGRDEVRLSGWIPFKRDGRQNLQ